MIPVFDLEPYLSGQLSSGERLASDLSQALREVGFYAIVNHGVSNTLIEEVFEQARRIHALPLERKLSLKLNHKLGGYYGPKEGVSKNATFLVRNDLDSDQWPPELPAFREKVSEYFSTMEALCFRLLPLYEMALALPTSFFSQPFQNSDRLLRLTHYPSAPVDEERPALTPHTDIGFLTLLPNNAVDGLTIHLPKGEWFDVPHIANAIFVNSGDLLQRWTNGLFVSTEHKVRRSQPFDRFAIPFFFSPGPHARIECLPTCHTPDNPPRYEPIEFGKFLASFREGRWYSDKPAGAQRP